MKDYFYFLRENYRKVSFGWLLTFLSSFGQTFLISLYVPEIVKAFAITEGTFGAIYAGCTVAASIIMLSVGHTVDHKPVKKVTAFTVLSLGLSSILLGLSYHIAILFVALIGLRLCGQGLMSHISMTIISKYFDKNRGKALSISSLGYSMGEAIFPIIITSIIAFFDWRMAAIISGIALLLYLIRLKFTNLIAFDKQLSIEEKPSTWLLLKDYKGVVADKRFGIMMPASFILGFTNTAIFFYQYVFVEDKSWSPQLYATFFTVYAISRFIFSLVGGTWVDKFTAKKMFRIYLIPMTLGLIPFALMDSIIGALLFLITAGITGGMAGTVKTSLIAEIYGTEKMGAIRSVFTMFMVISTALGPLLVGFMIDGGFDFRTIILVIFAAMVLISINSQRIKNISKLPGSI
ncbi:Predicted arabinose efflux permease, MFS family [Salegentibacter salegens]|uniref:Predicted arabinose efflux permease, MFS family n=1 Tax=Salegentibacter salegens TaxID=143223 RepID=A0A1M7LBN7_9FLAO|nr:putative MFS family arabinose efflux permease [Salegentibacter salegens]SHM74768.1 Predicted arabinose efflux permease, MFS family [Salegentibacter salegens]